MLSEELPPSCPGPISSGRSGLELRGEVWGIDVDLGVTGIQVTLVFMDIGPLHRRNGGELLLPGVAPEMGIWEVLGQHRKGVGG